MSLSTSLGTSPHGRRALSNPSPEFSDADTALQDQAESFLQNITIPSLPASAATINTGELNEVCLKVIEYYLSRWPDKNHNRYFGKFVVP